MSLEKLEFFKELFVEAIKNEDLKELQKLIIIGFPIANHINNQINQLYGTPLHLAAGRKNVEIVKLLIQHGAQIEAKSGYEETPLHKAQDIEVFKFLIGSGAQIDAKDRSGNTPLHLAVIGNLARCNFEVVKFLIENGAQIDGKNNRGKTPLHLAASFHRHKQFETVKFLVENGAQINVTDRDGNTPVGTASGKIKKFLIEKEIEQQEKASNAIPEKIISNKNPCAICLAPKNEFYILLPCMHSSLCESCCIEITKPAHSQCPSCRRPIERFAKIFFQ